MPAALHRAHGAERKAAGMVGIDQLVADRRRLGQNTEPAERIDPLELLDRRSRNAGAADSVKAVAAGDEVAIERVGDAVLDPGYARVTAVEIVRLHILGLVDGSKAGGFPRIHQVERDLGLAIDHDRLTGRGLHVDAMTTAGEGEL